MGDFQMGVDEKDIFTSETLERSLNATFLVLVPKTVGAGDIKDF